jgi:hypothetical protein
MKSFKMISLVIFIAITTITVKEVHSAMPESMFLQAKVTDIRNFEKCADELLNEDGIIDTYFNNSNNILTVIYDIEKISKDDIFDKFHKKGFKIKSQLKVNLSKNTEFIKNVGNARSEQRFSTSKH